MYVGIRREAHLFPKFDIFFAKSRKLNFFVIKMFYLQFKWYKYLYLHVGTYNTDTILFSQSPDFS